MDQRGKTRTDKKKSLVSVVCCQVEVSATGWSLIQGSPTECGVSECDREASTMRRPWPAKAVKPLKKKLTNELERLWYVAVMA
jgi:hypothetical protein